MKVPERIFEAIISRQQVDVDSMQSGLMPGRSTTNKIFILSQMLEKHHLKQKTMYCAFCTLRKPYIEFLLRCYGGA